MHIINLMFGKNGGGIEQAFVDYTEGLHHRGHRVTNITARGAWALAKLGEQSLEAQTLFQLNEWDIVAWLRLRARLKKLKPDVIIAHANRAYGLARFAARGIAPVVAVAQNYKTRRFTNAEAAFATTDDLIEHLVKQGVPRARIYKIPNMIRVEGLPPRDARRNPPVIGSMGRFVAKKGFDVFIDALALLKERGAKFRAVLGGSGVEEAALRARVLEKGLSDTLEFTGWVNDRTVFYRGLDVFCLPSHHEPFGIVLLEAFVHGTPVVATDSEGPRDIIVHGQDALVVPKADARAMADALEKLLNDEALAGTLAAQAFAKTQTQFSTQAVAERIEAACVAIASSYQRP